MNNILHKIKNFFIDELTLEYAKNTLSESLGFPEEKFDQLTNDLFNSIGTDRIVDLNVFIKMEKPKKYGLDLAKTNHLFLFGYATACALALQSEMNKVEMTNKFLKAMANLRTPIKEETNHIDKN